MTTDVHSHFFPPEVLEFFVEHGGDEVQLVRNDGNVGITRRHRPLHPVLQPAFYDLEAHLAGMDEACVDVHALSVPPPMVYWAEPSKAVDLCQLANNALNDLSAQHPSRLVPMASLPLQAPELAVEELRRVVTELGQKVVMIGANIAGTELDHPSLEPFWAEVEATDTAVFVHPIVVDNFASRFADYGLTLGLGMVMDTTIAMARVIASGLMDRHPGLRIGWSHLGGTLPFISDRVDYFHRRSPGATTTAEKPFSEYVEKFWYDTVVYSPRALSMGLKFVGPDRLMYGTDAPFLGDSSRDIQEILDGSPELTDADRRAIYVDNPAQFLRSLHPSAEQAPVAVQAGG
jgi:aminocarboxymuconate-semialdehyde decarboxylase